MAKIISVISGKGGTGKSTISSFIAINLAKNGYKVLAVDLDIGLRSLDILLSLENKVIFDFGDILDSKCTVTSAVIPHDKIKGLFLLSSPNQLSKGFTIEGLIDLIRQISPSFDYIVLDMPAGLGISVIMAKELADLNILVTTPDISTLRDTKKVSDAIYDSSNKPARLIINKVSKTAMQLCSLDSLDEIIDRVGIQLLGVIPDDKWISACDNSLKKDKISKLTPQIFDAIAKRITGHYVPLILRGI